MGITVAARVTFALAFVLRRYPNYCKVDDWQSLPPQLMFVASRSSLDAPGVSIRQK